MLIDPGHKPQIIVAQLGARRHYALPVLLERAGLLAHFYTDTFIGRGSPWHGLANLGRLIPEAWLPLSLRKILGRKEDRVPAEKVTAFNLFGFLYALAQRQAGNEETLNNVFLDYGSRFSELLLKENFNGANAVFAFEGMALPLFLRAQDIGIKTILEKFSAPALLDYELVSEEHCLWEGWEPSYPTRAAFQKRIDYEQAEWHAADAILCPSDFVAQGMAALGVSPEKLYQVPYGVETARFAITREPWDGRRPLHLLFVGGVKIRKGVQYLYEALRRLNSKQICARMVGNIGIREPHLRSMRDQAEVTGMVPWKEIHRHYEWADLFVFPSICEGSATVVYEALAAGLPVITTPNAGSVVRDGVDGFIVPIRDVQALAARIELLAANPGLLGQMAQKARERAAEFSWERYGERLVVTLKKIVLKTDYN